MKNTNRVFLVRSIASASVSVIALSLAFAIGCDDSSNGGNGSLGLDAGAHVDVTTSDAGANADTSAADATPGDSAPITIGEGFKPGLAVDTDGTAFIAWFGPENVTSTLQFCRLPKGAKACDVRKPITALGTSLSRPFVTVSGSTVRVVSYRYGLTGDRFDAIYLYTSTDRGDSFDAGRVIGSIPYNEGVVGPGDTISFATDAHTPGLLFENVTISAAAAPDQHALLSIDHPYSGAVGLVDANTPLVVFANGSGSAQFRRYDGSGSVNDVANWTAPQEIGHGEYMRLASGPSGLFLAAKSAANSLEVRRFDGSTFGAGVNIPEGTGELPQSHMSQDPAGRLHAVWPRIDVDGTRLYYASAEGGTGWQSRLVLTSPDLTASMRVMANADHYAVAAWEGPRPAIRVMGLGSAR